MRKMYSFSQLKAFCLPVLLILLSPLSLFSQTDPVILGSGSGGVNVTTSHDEGMVTGDETVNGLGLLPNMSSASRFLAQASYGGDFETIQAMAETSFTSWIEDQINTPRGFSLCELTRDITIMELDSTFSMGGDPNDVSPNMFFWHSSWWTYTMTEPDVLRQRIALALSEIFVISEVPTLEDVPLALADYYDMLLDNSLGNFRDLLEGVTLHPAMGLYLTHMNNPRADSTLNRFPDENYAREIMQLFTIGLYELNPDGTHKLDGNEASIPTYDNDDIAEFAKVFTGLTWGDAFLFGQDPQSELSFTEPMQMNNTWHEPGVKNLLNGYQVPDRTPSDGLADISDALDHLFNHPNVGPFIVHKLIQRMIKSNPSPEYIARVSAVFDDNGAGVRGDMAAVVKAILLDEEARDCALVDDPFEGMLREPILRYTQMCKAFNAWNGEPIFRNDMDEFYERTGQRVLGAPSVFNFFQPWYQPIGPINDAGLVAPEFQITNSVTLLGYANRLHEWFFETNQIMEYQDIFSGEPNDQYKRVNLDLTDEYALEEASEIGELLERLNIIMMHGQMSDATRATLTTALSQIPDNNSDIRVEMALFLVMISPDYLIFR